MSKGHDTAPAEVSNDGLNSLSSRVLLAALVLVGGGNGVLTVSGIQDRYTATQAATDRANTNKDIAYINLELADIKNDVSRLQANNPPKEIIAQLTKTIERVREIERHIDRTHRDN